MRNTEKLRWAKVRDGVYETRETCEGTGSPLYRVRRGSAPSGYSGAWVLFGWDGSSFRCITRPATLTEAKLIAQTREEAKS
jgi:hypothetical protein